MTTIHTRQLQQYKQDNYNNTHKTTTTIHTRQLQQYTQDNYNNTNKTTTTIHTKQLQQYTQDNLKLATIHAKQIRILQTTYEPQQCLVTNDYISDRKYEKLNLVIKFRSLSSQVGYQNLQMHTDV